MNPIIITILCVLIILVLCVKLIPKKAHDTETPLKPFTPNTNLQTQNYTNSLAKLPSQTHINTALLCEITDITLLDKIQHIVPNMVPILAASSAALHESKLLELGSVYQVVLENGGSLVASKKTTGAFRAFSMIKNKISEHAELFSVDVASKEQLVANTASSAMGVASMVVGQYYMQEINQKMIALTDGISKIATFQNDEYKSKIMMLSIQIKQMSQFQMEILSNEEQRKNESLNIQNLENTCIQLLEQSNLTLERKIGISIPDYDIYETLVLEIDEWYNYQQILSNLLYNIGELKHTFSLGAIPKDQCFASYIDCSNRIQTINDSLNKWHTNQINQFGIEINSSRRRKQGFEAFVSKAPGLLIDTLNYKTLDEKTASLINNQIKTKSTHAPIQDIDLYQNDVKLIVTDGKVFYYPDRKNKTRH